MTEYTPRHTTSPRFRRGAWVSIIAAVLALGLLGGGSAYAVWSSHATVSGAEIGSGDLDVNHGAGTWVQITPGVQDPASGSLDELGDTFVAMPGDVLELVVPFSTVLQGENLAAELNVGMGSAMSGAQEAGLATASYRIENTEGVLVAPSSGAAALNEPVTIDGLNGSAAGAHNDWRVVITVTVGGEYHWSGDNTPRDFTLWGSDRIHITLEQVRPSAPTTAGAE